MKLLLYPLYGLLYLLSRLPLGALYAISDVIFYPVYYVVRYRRKLVHRQLAECFPEKSEKERREIERRFYHFLCDIVVEYIKLITITPEEIQRRVQFIGYRESTAEAEALGKSFSFYFLGHYCNWEWLVSYALWTIPGWKTSQIYHPLRNKTMDRFLLQLRSRFGGECVPMKETLRHILTTRRNGEKECMAFIADQSPKWEAMHHWTKFLHHDTSFFIGTEKIGKQVNAAIYYVHVTRPRRGYYEARVLPITTKPQEYIDFAITNAYAMMLEKQIRECPELWLWTHNRWKRTRQEWERRKRY